MLTGPSRLRKSEQIEAIELLLESFASDLGTGTTNDDLIDSSNLMERVRQLVAGRGETP